MSLLEDLYRNEEYAENDAIETIIEQDREHDPQSDNDGSIHSEAEEEAPRKVEPPKEKKVVKNPRLTLNPKRLTGPRGIQAIEDVFKNFKFKGKGHEKEDLDAVMKNLEYWAHRLYPKFKFDDCLHKIATLGKKKEVNNHIHKIRMNLLFDDNVVRQSDDDDNNDNEPQNVPDDLCFDEFDRLLNQQIALAKSTPANNTLKTPSLALTQNGNSQSTSKNEAVTVVQKPELTTEQRERMIQNRLKAEEMRLKRQAMKENINHESNPTESQLPEPICSQDESTNKTLTYIEEDNML